MEDTFSKLPVIAKPSVYDIHLKPCLNTFKCPGSTSISLEVLKNTNFFKLHANGIDIETASLELSDGKVLNDLEVKIDKKWNTLTVNFPLELQEKSNVKLNFKHSIELKDDLQGFYRSSYKNANGEVAYMASTQFESTYARQAFPCWDEPTYKARFHVTLDVDERLTALSNMNIVEEKKIGNGKKSLKYAPTPLMSTYLVAFAVGEFEYLQTKSNDGIDVRVYTVPGKKELGRYSLELAAKCLDWYGDWFGIKCPLPKCDLIAIPDFSMGAMENWGLITFREVALLADPVQTSTLVKAQISLTTTHELAHFWFGNLVTMKWWTDLWLKEGFASFMEYLSVAHLCPDFNIWNSFIDNETTCAFNLDALKNSHPIEVAIENPNELDEIYDNITYSKSNCVNRMLYFYLGDATFQKGLRSYLSEYQYSNAATVDLWRKLSEASGEDVNTMMSSWTQKMGFPILSVQQKIDSSGKRTLKLHQERFLADGSADESGSVWHVPISVISAGSPTTPIQRTLFKEADGELVIEGVKPDEWIKLNANLTGFFRVQYTGDMLEAILKAVESKQLSTIDRFSIASDLFALVRAGRSPASQFFKFVSACRHEDEYIVWSAIDLGLAVFANILDYAENKSLKPAFNRFVCEILEPVADRLSWEPTNGEGSEIGPLRGLIISRLAKCQHKRTIDTALAKFDAYVDKNVELVSDLRGAIFGVVGRTNDAGQLARLQKIMGNTGIAEVQRSCIVSLGQCSDSKLLADVFKYCIEDGKIRSQDYTYIFVGPRGSREGKDFIWEYFKANAKKLADTFGSVNSSIFQDCLKLSVDAGCQSSLADEVEAFCKQNFDEHSLKTLDRPILQAIEKVKLNEKMLVRNVADVEAFLTAFQ